MPGEAAERRDPLVVGCSSTGDDGNGVRPARESSALRTVHVWLDAQKTVSIVQRRHRRAEAKRVLGVGGDAHQNESCLTRNTPSPTPAAEPLAVHRYLQRPAGAAGDVGTRKS